MADEKPAAEPDEKPARRAPAKRKTEGEICGECWPEGWPHKDANSAGCQHGAWVR